jgi:prepilin-type N-terminal cleavage/methylation domain-containing protein
MVVSFKQADKRTAANAFTLVEVMMALIIFGAMTGGLIYGYVQVNRMAEWSSMSLAAQSIASQGAEQARCAKWDTQVSSTNTGQGTGDELPPGSYINGFGVNQNQGSNYTLDIPGSGGPIYVTNYVTITKISDTPKLRQIQSDCVWQILLTGNYFTNTVITVRAPDQ